MATSSLREELSCSICLNLYKEPVSLKCGHNFCRDCIVTMLDTKKRRSTNYSCPECREQYTKRPRLTKNKKLGNIVDNFRSFHQMETKVNCTFFNHSVPATKSCLLCEASFCNKHLKKHSKSADHILTDPTTSFEDRKCSVHQEILRYYCSEDSACICMSCLATGDHNGHQVELLNEASKKKKQKLKDVTEKLSNDRQGIEKRIQYMGNQKKKEKGKAADVTGRVTELFRDIRESLNDVEKRILTEVSRQERQISQSVPKLIRELETQKNDLSRKINEIGAVCDITDPFTVLKKEMISDDIIPRSGDVRDAGCLDEGMISQMLHRGLLHFTNNVIDMNIKRRFSEMGKSHILLDTKTACNHIIISRDLKSATFTNKPENRPNVPERFTSNQVLSTQSFSSGRHYWEVDLRKAKEWLIRVDNHSIERKRVGTESFLGYNGKSWGLSQKDQSLQACHKKSNKNIESNSSLKTVGIYLDYNAGHLSFYQLCYPVRHLHTFTTTFTEPLYAAFYVFDNFIIRII